MPASVQAVLAARIDRLAWREKAVLEAAAVIGEEFPEPSLERVAGVRAGRAQAALRALVAGEFVFEQELYPEVRYAFRHPLTREVAYASQLSERRAAVHGAVARAIAEQYPERLDERAALLAGTGRRPATRSGRRAGTRGPARWAGTNDPTQALRHWRTVRELTDPLPESAERRSLGLEARIAWLNYGWRLGIAHEEAERRVHRGRADRLRERGRPLARAPARGLRSHQGRRRGDVRECARLARRAIALAEESGDPALYVTVALGAYALFRSGDFRESVAICDRAIELADGDHTVAAGIGVGCPYAFCHGLKGVSSSPGRLEEARRPARARRRARPAARGHGDGRLHRHVVRLARVPERRARGRGSPTPSGRSRSPSGSGTRSPAPPRGTSSGWASGREAGGAPRRGARTLGGDSDAERAPARSGTPSASRCSVSRTSASAIRSGRAPCPGGARDRACPRRPRL